MSISPTNPDFWNKPLPIPTFSVKGKTFSVGSSGTLSGVTQNEDVPVDLTLEKLRQIGLDTPVNKLQQGVVRLRIELDGKTLGGGSAVLISADGLLLSVNHVPAAGQIEGIRLPFKSGRQVLKNLDSWSKFLTGAEGKARLLADIPIANPESPDTIFSSSSKETELSPFGDLFSEKRISATKFYRDADTIGVITVPVKILAESPGEDLMLGKIDLPDPKDPYSFVRVTDSLPNTGDFVYSIGHPDLIKHNALACGEVLDPSFDLDKVRKSLEAHATVLKGLGGLFGSKGIPAKGLSIGQLLIASRLAGLDIEEIQNFFGSGLLSTNIIAKGSSGGLLANKDGEAVGLTYIGIGNDSLITKYIAGTLGLTPANHRLRTVTGSVSSKKAIPFLEAHGVNVQRVRDGEPSGIEAVEKRAARLKARTALRETLQSQGITSDSDIDARIKQAEDALGLPPLEDEKPVSGTAETSDGATSVEKGQYYLCGNKFDSRPKEIEIKTSDIRLNNDNSALADKILIATTVKTEKSPDGIKIELEIDPKAFDRYDACDFDTRDLLQKFFQRNHEQAIKLKDLVGQLEGNTLHVYRGESPSSDESNTNNDYYLTNQKLSSRPLEVIDVKPDFSTVASGKVSVEVIFRTELQDEEKIKLEVGFSNLADMVSNPLKYADNETARLLEEYARTKGSSLGGWLS